MKKNLKICASLASLIIAGNTFALSTANGEVVGNNMNIYKSNKVICDVPCDKYIVQDGDTFLDIARKVNSHYREVEGKNVVYLDDEALSRVLMRMNIQALPINPHDIILIPDTSVDSYNLMISINGYAENHYFDNVVSNKGLNESVYTNIPEVHHVVTPTEDRIPLNSDEVLALLTEVYGVDGHMDQTYGWSINVDLDTAQSILAYLGLDDKYYLSDSPDALHLVTDGSNPGYYDLTESLIYSPFELNEKQTRTR